MNKKIQSIEHKIMEREALQHVCAGWRVKGHKIVFTNGCFDILHRGHIMTLLAAAEQGHKLVVALNTDASVQKLKGPSRPLQHEQDRALIMAALTCVDAVILFDEETPMGLIQALQPDVLVKGGDYTPETVVGREIVEARGGKVVIIPFEPGHSTTGIIQKIKE
jgi:rfaE bifunctional protein nucleotidyltransferase chain/domain